MALALFLGMAGRRAHPRVVVAGISQGVMRVLRDAVIQRREGGGWYAMSREPAALGEVMVLDVGFDEGSRGVRVRVTDSRPVMVDGAVRHGIVLVPVTEEQRV